MSRILMYSLAVLVACGAFQKRIAGTDTEAEEKYEKAMSEENYRHAMRIALDKKLGDHAVRRAAYADMWIDIKNGVIVTVQSTATDAGLSVLEKLQFAETTFEYLIRSGKCVYAAEISFFFDLPDHYMAEAMKCEEQKNGLLSALSLACYRDAPAFEIAERKRKLFMGLDKYSQGDYWVLSRAVQSCVYDKTEILLLFDMTLRRGFYELGMIVIRKAEQAELDIDMQAHYRRVFNAAIEGNRFDYARQILKERAFEATDGDVLHYVSESIRNLQCLGAVIVAYENEVSSKVIEGVFANKRCVGSDFAGFEQAIQRGSRSDIMPFFYLALKYEKFRLAWALADITGYRAIMPGGKLMHQFVLDRAYLAKAYSVAITLPHGDVEEAIRFWNQILEAALQDNEEWFVAMHAHGKIAGLAYPDPEWVGWIERSYLHAMERGHSILAAQIAKSYGASEKLESRCRLAFETAMIAESPKDARFVLRVCGLKDEKLIRRAALMRYRQRQKAERAKQKAERKKRRERKKKKKKTDDGWSVKRE